MIAFITGRLAEKHLDHAVIDVGGIGLSVAMSTSSLAALPVEGDQVSVLTYLHVREEELSLFGFENAHEKELFAKLITVSGVGPKVALAALSSFTPDALVAAIVSEDDAMICSIPGIGKKTAQRIIIDLADKLGPPPGLGEGAGGSKSPAAAAEAREALAGMGFSSAEIAKAIKGYEGDPSNASALLRYALKRLGGGG